MAAIANAKPSKEFFVNMLTRDIELSDAILDLIDNCIDGIHRQIAKTPPANPHKPFAGFHANIDITPQRFSIADNCGGIPRNVAEQYAFRLGRPHSVKPEKIATVGLYGIGMKRALFKMGRHSTVTSRHGDGTFRVEISPTWLSSDGNWDLPITDLNSRTTPPALKSAKGTLIEVTHLYPPISNEFDDQKSKFLSTLHNVIATHYSYIIQKGFEIKLNSQKVEPVVLGLLQTPRSAPAPRIEPFVYTGKYNGVDVELVVGLYRRLPTTEEVENELEGKSSTGSKEQCGWSVICNDRVVVYSDKSRLTGWGEAGVPAYHPQFIAIAGMVRFHSLDVAKLPVTTTKRGIDASSDLYLAVKDIMREGLKQFTNFTNHWKEQGKQRDSLLRAAKAVSPFSVIKTVGGDEWTNVRKSIGGKKYIPHLPRPPQVKDDRVQIRFKKSKDEIKAVSEFLYGSNDIDANAVGEACFDRIMTRAAK